MINLELKENYDNNASWGRRLLYWLSLQPAIYNIKITNFPTIILKRSEHFIPFKINDKVFLIDQWDYGVPTNEILNAGIPDYYIQNYTTILKIQYDTQDIDKYNQLYKQYNIKVYPLIMFPNRRFICSNYIWHQNIKFKFIYSMTGKFWKNRRPWVRYAQKNHHDTSFIFDGVGGGERASIDEMNDWADVIQSCRWGLILKGRGLVGKNRREFEFSSCGMPLALNYKPHYHFDFEPNHHYVYLEKPEDLNRLYDIDPQPYSERSWEIYKKYFSPEPNGGLYNSFMHFYNH